MTLRALPAGLERHAQLIDQLRGELERRLEALHKAPVSRKLDEARFVMAAFFEVLHAQSAFNAVVIAELKARGS